MNIIKLKDQIRPGDDLFNTYLKGKYAYWIQMRYIVPFDFISTGQYVDMESDITKLTGWKERGLKCPDPYYWDLRVSNIEAWVDSEGTEEANNLNKFLIHNKFTADSTVSAPPRRRRASGPRPRPRRWRHSSRSTTIWNGP